MNKQQWAELAVFLFMVQVLLYVAYVVGAPTMTLMQIVGAAMSLACIASWIGKDAQSKP